jgi:hypothetical protein
MNQLLKLSGRVIWELLDSDGNLIKLGEQSNLITNSGLDAFAACTSERFSEFRNWLGVGTGANVPNATDTGITQHGSRSGSDGGFGGEETISFVIADNLYKAESRIVRVFTASTAANLTEFAFSSNSSGDISIRELFRDQNQIPITVSVQSGNIIKITHILTLQIPYSAQALSFNISGANGGTQAGTATWFSDGSQASIAQMVRIFAPDNASAIFTEIANTTSPLPNVTTLMGVGTYRASGAVQNYTNGTYPEV